ncbi:hypothetical protein [Streptomyces sp. NPDC052701]|uniref:hypothetical protein n=1 Tax=Streptomyces sp. NPDC052701 TaxID=3155533 RepID=UPI003434712F
MTPVVFPTGCRAVAERPGTAAVGGFVDGVGAVGGRQSLHGYRRQHRCLTALGQAAQLRPRSVAAAGEYAAVGRRCHERAGFRLLHRDRAGGRGTGVSIAAAGLGTLSVAVAATALGSVAPHETGVASGIVSTCRGFGAPAGAAAVSSAASSRGTA